MVGSRTIGEQRWYTRGEVPEASVRSVYPSSRNPFEGNPISAYPARRMSGRGMACPETLQGVLVRIS